MKIDWIDSNYDGSKFLNLDDLMNELDYAYEDYYPIIIDMNKKIISVHKLTIFENACEYKGHYSYVKEGLIDEVIIFLKSNKHNYKVQFKELSE
jgi:hypothetical protein